MGVENVAQRGARVVWRRTGGGGERGGVAANEG